ncbi:hypothetical protein CXG81DRAFT_28691 [Caulochytrium protostelioides]|uniref:Uncharacterized protein n=1 Tax=Caulochytrium protostelioides TaxID=1555241 RepID=A0A4P9X0I3_9FUNG|nr:hypothetical protein CXG81DRAFT_28691 [Caulochytrium protostelioides]|eukprot:RKO98482.1 hypothetical protein CXG81DRAFT_28691 [Caulochytrium protostelioides]
MAIVCKSQIGYPVYTLSFTPKKHKLLVGGGGGSGRSGVDNAITLYQVTTDLSLEVISRHVFSKEEDGVMSLAVNPKEKTLVAGVNQPEALVKAGRNLNCRSFILDGGNLVALEPFQTVQSTDPIHCQKVARFSPSGQYLATGTTDGYFQIWQWPSLKPAGPAIQSSREILDADISHDDQHAAFLTTEACTIMALPSAAVVMAIPCPQIDKKAAAQFRACRFGTGAAAGRFFTLVNAKNRKRCWINLWSAVPASAGKPAAWRLTRSQAVAPRSATCMTLSANGQLLAVALADFSVIVLHARTLKRVYRSVTPHDFSVTSLGFSEDATYLASGAIDGTVVLHDVRGLQATRSWCTTLIAIASLLVVLAVALLALVDVDHRGQVVLAPLVHRLRQTMADVDLQRQVEVLRAATERSWEAANAALLHASASSSSLLSAATSSVSSLAAAATEHAEL